MSLDSLCRCQVQVCVLCLADTCVFNPVHLMDICFLTCICLWQISRILTRLFNVVGPRLLSTSPAMERSSTSHPAGPHDRLASKTVNRAGSTQFDTGSTQFDTGSTQFAQQFVTAPPLVESVVWSLMDIFFVDLKFCHIHLYTP